MSFTSFSIKCSEYFIKNYKIMEQFLKKSTNWNKAELIIDTKIFEKNIILKAAYNFLDRAYFFFKYEWENILLQLTKKIDSKEDLETIVIDFSDELLSVYLRDKLEKDNKDIREKIVGAAIANSLDSNNFVSLDTRNNGNKEIDFDKDIDEILKEIENDPELKIDEEEIERILKEIEEETANETIVIEETKITLDINAVEDAKKKFQDR